MIRKAFLLLLISSQLSSCVPIIAASTAIVGVTVAEERTAGDKLDDNLISIKIKDKFVHEQFSELYSNVRITVHESRVMLTGNVKDEYYKLRAEQLCWEVRGVREVINELKIQGGGFVNYAKDSLILNAIRSKIIFNQEIKSLNYSLDSSNSVIYIIGIAQDEAERKKVLDIARSVKGVSKVVSHVLLKSDKRRAKP